ncbi:MAG: hypothetical protein WD876_00070 [Candidatus Pacearchaeota archaeon]
MGDNYLDVGEPRVIEDCEDSAVVYSRFDKSKRLLEDNGYRVISLEENAKLRIQNDRTHNVSREGGWTREEFVYDTNSGIYLTKNSQTMLNPQKAARAHMRGKEYLLTPEQVDDALGLAIKVEEKSIPTNRFGEIELTVFGFGDYAEDYGKWLKNECGVEEMPVGLTLESRMPFSRQAYLGQVGKESILFGCHFDLSANFGLRGVKREFISYPEKIEDALAEIHAVKSGNDYKKKFKLLQNLNKTIERYVHQQKYEDAGRLTDERNNLYKELR